MEGSHKSEAVEGFDTDIAALDEPPESVVTIANKIPALASPRFSSISALISFGDFNVTVWGDILDVRPSRLEDLQAKAGAGRGGFRARPGGEECARGVNSGGLHALYDLARTC